MFATPSARKLIFKVILESLRTIGPVTGRTRRRARAVARDTEADLDRMMLRMHDEIGLLSGEGCVTDWGLVERAARLRSGWA